MRILIATPHRNIVGGVEKYLQAIIPSLAARGHQIGLLHEHRFDPLLAAVDSPETDVAAWSLAQVTATGALRSIADWKPDVVYSNGFEAASLYTELLKTYPNVLYAHNYYGTCATGQKCHAFPTPQPCGRRFGIGCLVLHYPRGCGGLNPVTMWTMFQRSAEMNRQLQKYGAVLVGSAHMYREFEQHGVLPTQLHLVPLPNPESGLSVDSPVRTAPQGRLLFIGRLTRLKGAERLLRAVPIAIDRLGSRLTVTIAGDGPERARLQMLAQRLGVSVHFLGWVDDHRKATLMRKSDLLVVPSLWPEPFGLVGIEAGTHGLPAAAYEVGGITDWLIAGHNGELASGDPPTVQGLAAAIVRALSDTEHYLNLCRKARDVASRFSLEAHISRLETVLIKVTSEPAATFSAAAERIHA